MFIIPEKQIYEIFKTYDDKNVYIFVYILYNVYKNNKILQHNANKKGVNKKIYMKRGKHKISQNTSMFSVHRFILITKGQKKNECALFFLFRL